MFGRDKKNKKTVRDFKEDLMRNINAAGMPVDCTISNDEFTISIKIDGQKFEMTYGQAALILLTLSGIYGIKQS